MATLFFVWLILTFITFSLFYAKHQNDLCDCNYKKNMKKYVIFFFFLFFFTVAKKRRRILFFSHLQILFKLSCALLFFLLYFNSLSCLNYKIMTDDLASPFLGTGSNYFMPESRSISFAVEEEDPWSAAGFDPVDEMRQPLTQIPAMDDGIVTEGITASNVLGRLSFILNIRKNSLFIFILSRSRFTRDIRHCLHSCRSCRRSC